MAVEISALVRGKVQGVGFRWSALNRARELNLAGWVLNEPDGTVRVLAQGEAAVIDEYLDFLRRGPTFSRVENVSFERREIDKVAIIGFNII